MIQDTLSKVVYTADGLQRQWDVPFQFNDSEDLHIYLTDDGVRVEEVFQNFEFNKEGNYFIYPTEESGLAPLEAGKQILILRETPNTQLEDASEIYFKSKDIERGLDKLTMQVQELARDSYRAVKVSHFDTTTPEDFTEMLFEAGAKAEEAAARAAASESNASLSEQNAASSKLSAEQASVSATASAELAQNASDASLQNAERAEQAAAGSAASAVSSAESASLAQDLLNQVGENIYSKPEIDAKISGLQAEIDNVESYIPLGTNSNNTLINKQQLLDEEMDMREDLNEGLSELQTQITAQASAIAKKQDKLVAGANITIDGNIISATGGGGGGTGVDVEPATEEKAGIISISTSEEAREGFDDTTAMTPLKTAQAIYDNVGRAIQLGFDGTLSGNVLTFEPDTDTAYELKTGYNYTIDLLFPAVVADGALDENISMVINNNGESIKIVNALNDDVDTDITVGNMKQIMKYTTDIGFRWIFNASLANTTDGRKVFVMPSTVVNVQGGGGSDVVLPDNVYTQDNLLAGENVTITEVLPEGGIDEHTLACFHLDTDGVDVVTGQNIYPGFTADTSVRKFGTASAMWGNSISMPFSVNAYEDFSFDFWVFVPNVSRNGTRLGFQKSGFDIGSVIFNSDGSITFGLFGGYSTSSKVEFSIWTHIYVYYKAEDRNFHLFVNGKEVFSIQNEESNVFSDVTQFVNDGYTVSRFDEIRISDCIRWTKDFTPPTEPYTLATAPSKKAINAIIPPVELPSDLYRQSNLLGGKNIEIVPEPVEGGIDDVTVACWHFDGRVEDEVSGFVPDAFYSDFLVTSTSKFGSGCYDIKYASTLATFNEFDSFAVDFWYKHVSEYQTASVGINCDNYGSTTSPTNGYRLRITGTQIGFQHSKYHENNSDSEFVDFPMYSSGTWHHIVVQRIGASILQLFVDGVMLLQKTMDLSLQRSNNVVFYGAGQYFDEIRVSHTSRYNDNFTPPTKPYSVAVPTGNMVINGATKTSQLKNDSAFVSGDGVLVIKKLTQEEYDALETKNEYTLYVLV